ncbi:MAG: hypothetical protein ACFFE2_03065 [Candidatus Thorarchaeota archaeon]
MAFEDDLGLDPSQARTGSYEVSATGLVSRTFNLWTRKLVQYIIIVGLAGVALAVASFLILSVIFGLIGTIATNPLSYIFNLFSFSTLPIVDLIIVSVVFATVAFIVNAWITGAGTKFALDDYGGEQVADVGTSFSYATGKTLNIILVRIITTILVTGVLTPAFILFARALAGIDISDPFNPIISPGAMETMLAAMGYLFIGGLFALYISIRFAPVTAIVVDTDLSAIDSLRKSWELTSGNVFHVFGGMFLVGIVIAVIEFAVTSLLWFSPYYLVVQVIISSLLFTAIQVVFTVVLYRDLSSRRGDSSLDSLMVG